MKNEWRLTADGQSSSGDVRPELVLNADSVLAGVGRYDVVDSQRRFRVADFDPNAIRRDQVGAVELPDDVRLWISGEGNFEFCFQTFLDSNLAELLGDLGRVLLL